jgi:TolB protein
MPRLAAPFGGPSRAPLAAHALLLVVLGGACGGGDGPSGPQVGTVVVTVTTSGEDADPDGYVLSAGGQQRTIAGAGGSVTLAGLPAGDLTLALTGLAPHCTASVGEQTVRVAAGASASASFHVTCAPLTTRLTVAVTTTGDDRDADGYQLVVDGAGAQPVAADGASVTVERLAWGAHVVALTGVADNCAVVGEHPRTVQLARGDAPTLAMEVRCWRRIARVVVGRAYPTTFEGDTTLLTATAYAADGSVVVGAPITWATSAAGVASVAAVAGAGGDGVFSGVVSGLAPGSAAITARIGAAAASQTVVVLGRALRPNREIALLVLAPRPADGVFVERIRILGPDGGQTTITPEDQDVDTFGWSPDGSRLAVTYVRANDIGRTGLVVIGADGGGEVQIAPTGGAPQWSPDGSRIAYQSWRFGDATDIYTISVGGGDPRMLATGPGADLAPQWSPDGRQIAFTRELATDTPELWLVPADGSAAPRRVPLPTGARNPRWSPDGKLIAFDNLRGIWVVGADGANARPVTSACNAAAVCETGGSQQQPAWSPDARRLAFHAAPPTLGGGVEIVALDAATPVVRVPIRGGTALQWSPDGTRVLFTADNRVGTTPWPGFATMRADGTDVQYISGAQNALEARWRP